MTPENILLYAGAITIASIIPGPSMLLALSHGIRYGTKRTIFSAAGNVTATLLQAVISLAGITIILSGSGYIFRGIKYAGALYLIWLGLRSIVTNPEKQHEQEKQESAKGTPFRLYSQAFLVAFCNPKAILFFTALFPQIIARGKGTAIGYILLLSVLSLIAFLCFMLYAVSGERMIGLLRKNNRQKIFTKTIGIIFAGLGAGIILSDLD